MELVATLPIWKYSNRKISIDDVKKLEVGYIQRKFNGPFEKVHRFLPFSINDKINVFGEMEKYTIEITEQSFKSNLFNLKWNVLITKDGFQEEFLIEDKTKVSTNPRLDYHKQAASYIFKKDAFNRTCSIFMKESNILCAEVTIEKLVPMNVRIKVKTDDLTSIEILGIFYIMNIVY
ncbi:tubby C-terminal domain-like protein [Sporosarcina aquimarina]|uniref:Tubby C-terminal domain-containing protein n=1 Tax=Sporosarcina aquimarina TaxID=114975 RepID=A0ABU4FYB1_9BACL|nr:hypothetical protein [Sporosarcina aquimarina]MDW0109696.1 hypothetical protein [Sporosarcina aquimarina]